MDNLVSDSDSECFESAEESVDENEKEIRMDKSVKAESLRNVESDRPAVHEKKLHVRDDSPINKRKGKSEAVAYRKRPEKTKYPPRKTSAGSLPSTKTSRTDSIFKTDAITPDHLIKDITNNLSRNINKSLNTIQQTSSNVKDLIINSIPVTGSHQNETFSYDDVNFTSPPNEGDGSLSKTLSQLSLSQMAEILPSTDLNEINSNETQSEKSCKSVNIFDNVLPSKTHASELKCNPEIEPVKTKLFSLNLPKTFNIPEISDFLKLTDETSTSENSNHCANERTTRSKSIFKPRDEINILNEVHSIPDCEKKEKHSTWIPNKENMNDISCKIEKASNILSNEIREKTEELKKSACELKSPNWSPLKSEAVNKKEASDKYDKIRMPPYIKDSPKTSSGNVEADQQELHRKLNIKKLNETEPESNENPLMSLESCYDICEKLPTDGDSGSVQVSEEPHDGLSVGNNINWNDPVDGWLEKPLMDDWERESWDDINDTTDEKKQVNLKKNKKGQTGDIIEGNKSNDGKTSKPGKSVTSDGWDDFDFSDSETNNSELSNSILSKQDDSSTYDAKMEENSSSIYYSIESGKGISHDATNNDSLMNSKDANCPINKEPNGLKEKRNSKSHQKKETAEVEGNDDWNWDNWDDVEACDSQKVGASTETLQEKMSNISDSEIWSGWDTFGQKSGETQSTSTWSSWGMNMLLDKATAVTQGISNVLEAGLGAPDPQILAMIDQMDKNNRRNSDNDGTKQMKKEDSSSTEGTLLTFGRDLVAGVKNKIVENSVINPAKFQEIGTKVITGGLDTLESFGKKTMEVLQEGDPGLKNKRALFMGGKPTLSQVLREIKDKTEKELKEVAEREIERKCHFEGLFDDYQGLIHLEALEMLSKQCEFKLEQIRNNMTIKEQEDLDGVLEEVQQLCSLDDYDLNLVVGTGDFKKSLMKAVEPLNDVISVGRIIEIHEDVEQWLGTTKQNQPPSIILLSKLVSTLAQLTSAIVHQYHKGGELLSVKECRKTVEEIDALSEMTNILIFEIGNISSKFIGLSKSIFRGSENLITLINRIDNVFNNSTSYIKQAFHLLIPVLQVGAAV